MDLTEDRLSVIMRLQREFQEDILGHGDLTKLLPHIRADYFRTQAFALTTEIGEASAEIGWKPWASDQGWTNDDAYESELIDAFHFLLNLMLLSGMTPDRLYEGYIDKQRKNRNRQRDGYDGRTSKCPSCRRDYNDAGVKCRPAGPYDGPKLEHGGWCQVYGELAR